MSPVASFHSQLASIMEVLANTAVAEICELVDSGYAVLQLEISRSRRENEVLRRKLRLMELKASRGAALRAIVNTTGGSRVQLVEQRRSGAPTGGVAPSRPSNQDAVQRSVTGSLSNSGLVGTQESPVAVETSAVIKVEEVDDNLWSQSESEGFHPVSERRTETQDLSSPVKQELDEAGAGASQSWTTGEVSSTSTYIQKKQPNNQGSESSSSSSYERLLLEPPAPPHFHTAQNVDVEPGCSSMLNSSVSDSGSSSFSFTVSENSLQPVVLCTNQQRALTSVGEPQPIGVKDGAGRQSALIRRDGWRQQGGVNVGESRRKSFVCNYCGKKLACLKNLTTHMRVHTGEKPFVCMLCGKRFSDSSNLKRHQSVHTGEKRYSCVRCGKRFAQSGSLKVHMTMHTDCKDFRCSYCNKMFISSSHLRQHITIHAAESQAANTSQ